jgi:hypothetical protein
MVRKGTKQLTQEFVLRSLSGILHVDYEALLPFLNESIKRNYQDITNLKAETQQLQKSIDILYSEFVKREAIVKYQHNPSSMFSDNAMPNKKKGDSKDDRPRSPSNQRRPFWHCILFVLACLVLFASGSLTVHFVTYQSQSPNSDPPLRSPTIHDEPPLTTGFNRTTDRLALEELYLATGGANWTNSNGWLTATDFCSWFGVKCDADNRVSTIKLAAFGLNGTIPASIGHFDHLTDLALPSNDIYGTIPPSLFTLPLLRLLDVASNPALSGTIPSYSCPPSFTRLWASDCNLTGTLPNWITGSNLKDLFLQNNRFTGTIPVLPQLTRGYFQSNQFEGSVPRIIGTFGSINLSYNRFSGTLQSWRSFSANTLILANNSFSGGIPFSNSQFKIILTMDISNNNFTTFPPDILLPPMLGNCDASNNPFKCPIPRWLKTECGATCT